MKQTFCFLITILFITSCQSQQSKAMKDQQKAYDILKSLPNGAVATSDGSWTMTATIDGKSWKANYMYSPEATSRIISHYNDESIELPYWKQGMVVGKTTTFKEGNATDLFLNDEVGIYGGTQGEMVITKVNGGWVEGTFHFVASSSRSSKTVNVTNGFFRIQISK